MCTIKTYRKAAIRRTGAACLLSLGAAFLGGCGGGPKTPADPPDSTAAKTTQAFLLQKGKLSTSLQIPGELIGWQQVDLYAKVNSFVKTVYVDVGSEVREGDLLATMEAPELTAQIDAARSRVSSAEAQFVASLANYQRMYETSLTPGTISQNDLDQAQARKSSDSADPESARFSLKELEDTRDYLVMRAPFAGVISSRNINPGAYVGPSGKGSDQPMFTLQEQSLLRLIISVPEMYTGYLTDKSEVTFTVKALPASRFTARVARRAGAIDDRLRSEHVEMDVKNTDRRLLPGMVAEVDLPLPADDSTFVVPQGAVVNSMLGIFVIRVVRDTARWIPVRLGRQADGHAEIYGKINPGDTLVQGASEEVRDGMPLKAVVASTAGKP